MLVQSRHKLRHRAIVQSSGTDIRNILFHSMHPMEYVAKTKTHKRISRGKELTTGCGMGHVRTTILVTHDTHEGKSRQYTYIGPKGT